MVKSQFYTFVSICFLAGSAFCFFLFLQNVLHFFGIIILTHFVNDDEGSFFLLLAGLAGTIFLLALFSYKFKILKIDETAQLIIIKNFTTRKEKVYKFSEIDGYQDTIVRYGKGGGTPYQAIEIIKDKKVLLKMDALFCSNIDEIKDSLSQLKFLGIDIDWRKDGNL